VNAQIAPLDVRDGALLGVVGELYVPRLPEHFVDEETGVGIVQRVVFFLA
jgi:hypothetical protein